ncbi:PEP-CTERM sorting domain-containing protein [archaeon]|jgi:hypothetical protein|nr:PEP-CTERM sorting domain-containing protein [archaeon]
MLKINRTIVSTIAITLIALAITNNAQADPIIPIPSGSTGGGGGSTGSPIPIPHYFEEARIYQEINFIPGWEIGMTATNRPETTEQYIDQFGNIKTYVNEQSCSGSLRFELEQGAMDTNILPRRISVDIERRNNTGQFQVEITARFLFVDQNVDDWTEYPHSSLNWNDPLDTGLRFSADSSMEHDRTYSWPGGYDEEPIITISGDIRGNADFWFALAEIDNARLWVDDYTHTVWDENSNKTVWDGMEINAYFDLTLVDSDPDFLAAFNSAIPLSPTAVPEPATMSLLALGGLAALRRRRRN